MSKIKVTKYTVILTGFNGRMPDGPVPSICYDRRKPLLVNTRNQALLYMIDMKRDFNAEYAIAEVSYDVSI